MNESSDTAVREALPSVWTMDRAGVEETLRLGRSPSSAYSERDKLAVRAVLDRTDFDMLSREERVQAFATAWSRVAAAEMPSAQANGSKLPTIGWLLIAASVTLCLYAYLGYDTSVETDSSVIGGEYIPVRNIINNGLLQNQLMLFLAGIAGMLSGVAALLAGSIVTTFRGPEDSTS